MPKCWYAIAIYTQSYTMCLVLLGCVGVCVEHTHVGGGNTTGFFEVEMAHLRTIFMGCG